MITNPTVVWILIAAAALLATATATPFVVPLLTRIWRNSTPLGRFAFAIAASISLLYGGTKTNGVDSAGSSSTNLLTGIFRRVILHAVVDRPAVTEEDVARGWQTLGPYINTDFSYTMPEGATLATNWWLRGAFEDVTPVSNLWAHSWGKVRFALDDTNEIVAVGAPMSAVPFCSRLWSATDTNDAFRITWEDFLLGRSNALVSAQIEFRPNGDYVTRSNEIETVWRRIDPDDFDGDGYLNDDDPNLWDWDDGANLYYGPQDKLPADCNEEAYCSVTIAIDGTRSQYVTFLGDGPSNYDDPYFIAKPGVAHEVKILIGKTYSVTCDAPIRVVEKSDDEVLVLNVSSNSFTVVWPVTITQAQLLRAAPPPGLLGGSHGNTGFTLDVDPPWLDGDFEWTTNTCCQIVDNGDWWSFACEDGCNCGGCEIGGSYLYEEYEVVFDDIRCGCHYESHDSTRWGISAPVTVFKDGDLRPLHITFHHGDPDDPEEGELLLNVIRGSNSGDIRIWEDAEKTSEASTFSWDVSTFSGHTFYLEGVKTSSALNDIEFELVWTRPGGTSDSRTDSTTCAEVEEMEVTSDMPDGSSNQQPFAGHMNWDFDVTHSPDPDKHFAVLFRDAINPDFTVKDFTVQMTLVVKPRGAPVGTASWFPFDPTPASGTIVSTGNLTGELRNPKVGGVYHIGACFDGSPTNECNIVLPLAGAEMYAILQADVAKANAFASTMREKYNWFERNSIKFGRRWFVDDGSGDYLGRPDSAQTPSVWCYGTINDTNHMGNVCTLAGVPIRLAKLSNMLAGYTCEKLGVLLVSQWLSQLIGHFTWDLGPAWQCGRVIANGDDYYMSVTNMVHAEWRLMDDKTTKPWPNPSSADNWQSRPYYIDFDRRVYSPGMIYQTPE